MSVFNGEVKKLIVSIFGVLFFLIALVWVGSNSQSVATFATNGFYVLIGKKTYDKPYSININKSKNYILTVDTNLGVMTFKLDKDNTINTVNNIYNLYKNDFYKNSSFIEKDPKYLLLGHGGKSDYPAIKYSIPNEINADSLGLNKVKVSDFYNILRINYDDATIRPNLDKSVKDFYTSLGYVYDTKISSTPILKGSVVMYSLDPNKERNSFFISTLDAITEIDGRMTKFGDIISGQEVLDKIIKLDTSNTSSPSSSTLVLNSITVDEK